MLDSTDPRPVSDLVGHNQPPSPTFSDDVEACLAGTGLLSVCLDRLIDANLDPRITPADRAVLSVLIRHMNSSTAMAWPSRETIAMVARLTVKSVQNALYTLKEFGYVSWSRRAPTSGGDPFCTTRSPWPKSLSCNCWTRSIRISPRCQRETKLPQLEVVHLPQLRAFKLPQLRVCPSLGFQTAPARGKKLPQLRVTVTYLRN